MYIILFICLWKWLRRKKNGAEFQDKAMKLVTKDAWMNVGC